jgi:hypothetical protein
VVGVTAGGHGVCGQVRALASGDAVTKQRSGILSMDLKIFKKNNYL